MGAKNDLFVQGSLPSFHAIIVRHYCSQWAGLFSNRVSPIVDTRLDAPCLCPQRFIGRDPGSWSEGSGWFGTTQPAISTPAASEKVYRITCRKVGYLIER